MSANHHRDAAFRFAATVLAARVPMTVRELRERVGIHRATAYRMIEDMQKHFPVEFEPGNGGNPGKVWVRRTHG